jgi:branched-chain amino acid transport system ATP-binding protein
MAEVMLQTLSLRKEFGGLVAVDDVDFGVDEGTIVSLIGPNGAGKTTFFNMLTGVYKPTVGRVVFDGQDLTGKPPHTFTQHGIGRTFQNIRLFKTMTALENVLVGMHVRLKGNLFEAIVRTPRVRHEEATARETARELLNFCSLGRVNDVMGKNLSYGDQRRLEVARALATQPKLLLLDEPTAGMNPQETLEFTNFVSRLRTERGLTVLLIEHDMRVVMGVSDRVTVLDYGKKIAEGTPQEIQVNERVIEAYLGSAAISTEGEAGEHAVRRPARPRRPAPAGAPAAAPAAMLALQSIETFYGSIQALKGISIEVHEGEIVTLIGANGAGKSTTLRSINGLNHPRHGKIWFQGRDITNDAAHHVVQLGIAQSPEGRKLFPRMTVTENLEMGAFQRRDRSGMREDMDRVFTLFPRLAERQSQKAGTMSGGEQQMCAIGRALMARPTLLMLDEPSMGLAPIFVERIFETIVEVNKQGTSILLVEQNALMALEVADRGYVLETGAVKLADDADALARNDEVRKTYLGV